MTTLQQGRPETSPQPNRPNGAPTFRPARAVRRLAWRFDMAGVGKRFVSTMSDLQRFCLKISYCPGPRTTSCWIWTGAMNPDGYGQFYYNGRGRGAHRAAYQLFRGSIPKPFVCDHLCRNPRCVNPFHIEIVTVKENTNKGAVAARTKTACPQGHPYDERNTCYCRSKRHCRECGRIRSIDKRRRQRAALAALRAHGDIPADGMTREGPI